MSNTLLRFTTLVLTIALVAGSPLVAAQSNGQVEVMLREAKHAEVSDGDLERAIELYRAIVEHHADVRPVAAQALLRIGMCYEKLGRLEAQAAYQQLMAEYGDQRELAAEAGSRLAAMGVPTALATNGGEPISAASAHSATRLASELPGAARSISPAGDKVTTYDFRIGQNIGVVDLASGNMQQVTDSKFGGRDVPDATPYFYDEPAVFSPDGSRIVATRGVTEGGFYWEIGIADLDGGWRSVYRGGGDGNEAQGVWASDWLPDGSGLIGVLQGADKTYALGVFSLGEPSFTPVVSLQWDFDPYSSRPDLSPDGRFIVYEEGERGTTDIHIVGIDGRSHFVVTEHPADDKDPVWSPDGRHVVFLSRRLGSYGLWGIAVQDGRPTGEPFLIEEGMAGAKLIDWIASGLAFSKRNSLRDGFTLAVDPETREAVGEPEQIRYPLTGRTEWASFSPDGQRIALVHGRRDVVVLSPDGSDVREFALPTSKGFPRNFQWLPDDSAVSFMQPDEREQPTIYKLDVESGELSGWPAPSNMMYPPMYAWTGRGDSIFYVRNHPDRPGTPDNEIVELDLATDEERVLLSKERANAGIGGSGAVWIVHWLSTSPDLRSLAFHANRGGRGPGWTFIMDVESGDVRPAFDHSLPNAPTANFWISWSRDSRRIYWGRASVDVTSGALNRFSGLARDRFSFIDPEAAIRSIHWSPATNQVLFTVQSVAPEVWLMTDVIPAGADAADASSRR